MAKSFSFNPFTGNFDLISEVTIGTANGLSIDANQALSLALSSTSTTGALSSTDWNTFNGKQAPGNYITALTGDGTASGPGSAALTLATVNANVGSFGGATSVSTFTVNGKGLITAAGSTSIQIAESQVTNLVSDLAGKQPVGNYITALTGDGTASGPGSAALTLATVNANVGSFGGATSVSTFTVNGKGLITAAGSTSIQIAESQVTNLVSDLAGKQPAGNYITALTSDVTASGPGSAAATIANNAVSNAKFRQSGALSVVGNATNATANVADITAASDGQVLLRSGTSLAFGAVSLSTAAAVTGALPIGNGGTGQTTASAAFDALSPVTTKGDLIARSSTSNIRIPVGSDGQVLKSDSTATGGVSWFSASFSTPTSEVWVQTANGYGSTNTPIRRWTTTVVNNGSNITYADSATLGGTFTINANGIYSISYCDQFSTTAPMGVTRNDTQLTTNLTSTTTTNILVVAWTSASNVSTNASVTLHLTAGDVIRCKTNTTPSGGNPFAEMFRIVQVLN